jgi:tetratricopeptide (TPR) repeat protein
MLHRQRQPLLTSWVLISLIFLGLLVSPGEAAKSDVALKAYQQGVQLLKQGQKDAATQAIQRAVANAPDNRGMRTHLAWLLLEQDRPQEALPHFQHLAASGPEDKNIGMGLAISYLKLQHPEQAVAVLDRTLADHPDDPLVLKLQGEALLSRQETAERAWKIFTRLAQRFPSNQEWQRRRQEAGQLAARYYYQTALRHLQEGNKTSALQALKESVRFDTLNVGYRTHYGWMLGDTGYWTGASQQFQEVLLKDPEKKDAHLGLAQARLFTGDYAGAREAASQGLSRYPDDPGLLTILGEALAADPATKAEAIRHFERLTAVAPEDNQAAVRLARLYIELGDLNAGQRILEKVITRTPDYAPAQFTLGQMNLWADAYGVAAGNFRQVLKQEPENQEARHDLDTCETFLKPQIQVQGGFFEDSETFRSAYMFTGTRVYITPTLRVETGYGYLTYSMGNNPQVGRTLERSAHRHALPLVLYYRPSRQLALEVGGVLNDYGVWGNTGNARAGIFYQATPQTGLSLSYDYHDIIDYQGPFKGPYGRMLDDFAEFERYRYLVIDPVSLWSSNIFGASSTQAITQRIQGHQFSFWGYQNFLSRLTLSLYGSYGDLTDGNNRMLGGATLTCRIFQDPLVKAKYSFFYIDYRRSSASLANLPSWSAPLYWDPQGFKNHSVGIVFEQNWAKKFKLAWETDILFNQGTATPGFLGLVELDYLLTSNIVLRVVGSYSHSVDQGDRQTTSYQVRNIFGGLSYRF